MRASIYLCLVVFVLLVSGFCIAAEVPPTAPWINQGLAKPADGTQIRNPRDLAGAPVIAEATPEEPALIPSCFRIVRLQHRSANEMVLLFNPKTNSELKPFLPRGIFVSRAGDNKLLVTAVNEDSLDQVAQLVKLFDQPPGKRLILEVMLVESTQFIPLPKAIIDSMRYGHSNGASGVPTSPFMEALAPFLQHPETIIYRTFLDIPRGQQGVVDLSAYPLLVAGVLFGQDSIHPDGTVMLTLQSLPKQGGQKGGPRTLRLKSEPDETLITVKDHSVLSLNSLLPVLRLVKDPAEKAHYLYLFVGVNISRGDRIHLADNTQPLRVCYDGRQKPAIIPLHHTDVRAMLLHGEWLQDTVTPPMSWPQRGLSSFSASPSMNALVATGDPHKRAALQQFIASIDIPQQKILVEGQYLRIGVKDLQELGLRQNRDGAWSLPYGENKLQEKISLALINNKAKLVMMPRVIVQPFGTGSEESDGWGMRVDQAYTRHDGIISLQVATIYPPLDAIAPRKAQVIETLEVNVNQPVVAGIYPLADPQSDDVLLFVVKAVPVREDVIHPQF